MANKINWNLIKDFESFNNQVKLIRKIGPETTGVFKAQVTQGKYQCIIAVKRIELIDRMTENQIINLQKEKKFLNQINNSNIVKVYFQFAHLTELEKKYYIGMEYGFSDLNSIIYNKGKQSENEISNLAQQVWNGLNYLEENQVDHKNLKPENIILGLDGTYKLCNIGEVKQKEISPFLAPELIKGYLNNQTNINYNSAKSDTFSYGVLLYHALIGCTQQGIQIINTDPQMFKDFLNMNCSESFKWFLSKCLEFDPKNRWTFKDMKEIFNLNSIEAYYQICEKNKQIRKLEESLNKTSSTYQNQISQLNLQIQNLYSKNNKLTEELQEIQKKAASINSSASKIQIIQQPKNRFFSSNQFQHISSQEQQPIICKNHSYCIQQLQQSQIQENEKKTQEIIIKICKQNQKVWEDENQTYKETAFNENTKGLRWNSGEQYYYEQYDGYNSLNWNDRTGLYLWTYWQYNDGQPRFVCGDDIPAAIQIVEDLVKVTDYEFGLCLRMLHSNLWNFEKSKNDLLN